MQCNTYIIGPSFNLLFGLFRMNSAWLAPTLPQMPEGRSLLYSIEQNMSLKAMPPSSSLARGAVLYVLYITVLRHFQDEMRRPSIAAAMFSDPTVYHVSEVLSTGM